jgi:hypothetical protein
MFHDKLESILRNAAQSFRLEAEKRRAQIDRLDDSKLIERADKALGDLARKRMRPGSEKLMDAVTAGDQSAVWRLERVFLQREAKSRGLLKKDLGREWAYEQKPVDKNGRPAEKLVKGGVKVDRWMRIKRERNEAMATEYYAKKYYYDEVLRQEGRRDYVRDYVEANPQKHPDVSRQEAEKAYDKWRNGEIANGIRDGFIERDSDGKVFATGRRNGKVGPAEKLVTGKTRGKVKGRDVNGSNFPNDRRKKPSRAPEM